MFSLLVLAMCTLQFAPAQAAEGRTPLIREMNADVMGSRDIMAQSQLEPDLGGMRPIAAVRKELSRVRRQANHAPVVNGDHQFNDGNNFARIHYSGNSSQVILVLTFLFYPIVGFRGNSNLYRSTDYGATFLAIEADLDENDPSPSLWYAFRVSPINKNLIIFTHATLPKLYYSTDEGSTWSTQTFPVATINPRSLVWNSVNDRMALAHDSNNDQLYVTQNLGASWAKIADYVDLPSDYQWGDPDFDSDHSMVYFNTYNPNDRNRLNFTVNLMTQHSPYDGSTLREFDPSLGRHDDFLLLGPYIFVQKTDSNNKIQLYISYQRQPFNKAMIPSTDPHQNYLVSHIQQQQALVIVEHVSGQFNLYLSDITGVYFSLSLPDIVNENYFIDLELIEGINGTLVANQYVPGRDHSSIRTLVSLDNGGNWEFVRPPTRTEQCLPPQCSLHFHMTTSDYARTGVYSQASAPGLILAHGNTGSVLNDSPDLYISRDGGVTWSLTLRGSWGVTVVDHGGLLVAARDYHNRTSSELMYSCTEGMSWNSFTFSSVSMIVYGVITEPGEHTTTVSLYGWKNSTRTWDVVTVNFSSIFPFTCSPSHYYGWHPWDDRTDQACILGSSVTIERRNASVCCLIGKEYTRVTAVTNCFCNEDDFECDYGYARSDSFTGVCVRDSTVPLPSGECLAGQTTHLVSQGYRKIAGDVCSGGVEGNLGPVSQSCCATTPVQSCDPACVPGLATCQQGSVCACIPGYSGDGQVGGTGCRDVDECGGSSSCSPHASCTNTAGSYQCACGPGYVGDGLHCYNSNECLDPSSGAGVCASNALCSDTDGSFTCTCQPGYTGDGLASGSGCSECSDAPCAPHAACSVANGNFTCICDPGYSGDGLASSQGCVNINECSDAPCVSGARCVDLDGSVSCTCSSGYVGDGLASGSGCAAAQVPTSPASLHTTAPTIALGVLLGLALGTILVMGITTCVLYSRYHHLKSRSYQVGGARGGDSQASAVHFRNTPADERPLTWNNPDEEDDDEDDDEPLLT